MISLPLDEHSPAAAAPRLAPPAGTDRPLPAPDDEEEDVFVFPATAAQRRFWLLDQLVTGGNPALNVPLAARLRGTLDRAALERAFNEVVARHEILRTTFQYTGGQLSQVIAPVLTLGIPLVDVQDFPEAERAGVPDHLTAEEAARGFDLARGPLLRARLVRLSAAEHLLLFPIHHIVSDGWSNGVLLREISALYAAFAQGRPSPLPPLPIQFADFAQWQQDALAGGGADRALAYWRGQLAGELPVLDLPTDRPRPPWRPRVAPGALRSRPLPDALARTVKALAVREGASPFMAFLAAFALLLNRYTAGQEDILLGTSTANRDRREVEGLIGLFVNPLLLRLDLSGGPTFRALLARTRQTVLGAFEHADAPFERIIEEVQPRRLQVNFLYQTAFLQPARLPDLEILPLRAESGGALFEWNVLAVEEGGSLRVDLEYNPELFDAATVDRALADYERLLSAVTADGGPDTPITRLPLASADAGAATVLRAARWRLPEASARWVDAIINPDAPEAGTLRPGAGLRVLDRHGQPAPVGVPGEIEVASLPGRELFLTGDAGRLRPDGSVQWLGPMASQCQSHGLRADFQAVEAALHAHPHVREAVALRRGGAGESCQSAAYFVSDGVPAALVSPAQLRAFLQQTLPEEAIPAAFVLLPGFPLTADGRLDEAALPGPADAQGRETTETYQAPYLPIHHQLIAIWQELLGARALGVRDDFFALGGGSLLAMRMLYRVEQDFGKTILPAALFRGATVEHLADEILRRDSADASPELVKVQENGAKTPIFFLHGDIAGGGFYCRKLSRGLGGDQPFYALPPVDVLDPLQDRPTVADMAAAHLAAIRSVRPRGPYVIGGFCLGGLVAYEVACQLEAAGETVERLLIIDAKPRDRRLRRLRWLAERVGRWRGLDTTHHLYLFCHWHYLTVHWDRLRAMSLGERWAMLRRRLRRGRRAQGPASHHAAPSSAPAAPPSPSEWFDPVQDIPTLFMWAAGGYAPRPYGGAATLLMSSDLAGPRQGDPSKEWKKFIPNLQTARLEGKHLECITAHADGLAAKVKRCLNGE